MDIEKDNKIDNLKKTEKSGTNIVEILTVLSALLFSLKSADNKKKAKKERERQDKIENLKCRRDAYLSEWGGKIFYKNEIADINKELENITQNGGKEKK